jgi:potassium-transporting ATPase KdpC subunit
MKENILPAIKITIISILFFSGLYTLIVLGIAQFTTNEGEGEIITYNGKEYYNGIGQKFTEDKYFYSRPSAIDFNASGSCGSNKGPTNPQYLKTVQNRIDTFLVHNPDINKEEIPSDIVTASASGLDPHISVQAAIIQIKRVSKFRGLKESTVKKLVLTNVEKPWLNIFGTERVNVLKLNIALDKMNI